MSELVQPHVQHFCRTVIARCISMVVSALLSCPRIRKVSERQRERTFCHRRKPWSQLVHLGGGCIHMRPLQAHGQPRNARAYALHLQDLLKIGGRWCGTPCSQEGFAAAWDFFIMDSCAGFEITIRVATTTSVRIYLP